MLYRDGVIPGNMPLRFPIGMTVDYSVPIANQLTTPADIHHTHFLQVKGI